MSDQNAGPLEVRLSDQLGRTKENEMTFEEWWDSPIRVAGEDVPRWQLLSQEVKTACGVAFAAGWAAGRERCAKIADEHARRNYPWGSENTDRYHAQADLAERIAAVIRRA